MSDGKIFDVAVVGGGPAGASAAYHLASAGISVCVLEKAMPPRYKTCGGGVVWRARKLLPDDSDGFIERAVHSAEVRVTGTPLIFRTERRNPIITMTMRESLDANLLLAAQRKGAVLKAGCAVNDLSQAYDAIRLNTPEGAIEARFVVAADGATGITARKAGWSAPLAFLPALEWEVYPERRQLDDLSTIARFDFGFDPHGYAWVFPKQDHLSVGLLSRRSVDLKPELERYMLQIGLPPGVRTERHGYVIPLRPRKDGFAKGRVLLVGDSAGFVDPITGEGISFALLSGRLAARAILDGDFDPQRVAGCYYDALDDQIVRELKLGGIIAKLVYDSPGVRNRLFRLYGQRLSEAVTDVLMGERTYRQILGSPRTYLKLLQFRRSVREPIAAS